MTHGATSPSSLPGGAVIGIRAPSPLPGWLQGDQQFPGQGRDGAGDTLGLPPGIQHEQGNGAGLASRILVPVKVSLRRVALICPPRPSRPLSLAKLMSAPNRFWRARKVALSRLALPCRSLERRGGTFILP